MRDLTEERFQDLEAQIAVQDAKIRKRRRHWKRQAVRRQIQAWSIDFAIGKDQNVTKWIRIGEQ